ncbi:hypothetical protein HNR42_003156 [Deinobacterium chartae]|uniref:Uncharacterized protein n=1 Tax=Deinobacterium chartae TaxID=521158 RepID=A0A841I5H3_9DEIO|nr:hypothetical protein [Deinobacterium chartae]MBB6099698.1 hypothetical protein [Deinobacterium chartae]
MYLTEIPEFSRLSSVTQGNLPLEEDVAFLVMALLPCNDALP